MPIPDKNDAATIKILSRQLAEQNKFARTNIHLLVQWFIFFATANYVVIGYFVLKMLDAPLKRPTAFYWVAALFVAVNVLGLVLSWEASRWFSSSGEAVQAMLRRLHELTNSPPELVAAAPPYVDYARVVALMGITVLTMLSTWVVMTGATARASKQQTAPTEQTIPAEKPPCSSLPLSVP